MPSKALRFCAWHGCSELVSSERFCNTHKPMHEQKEKEKNQRYNQERGSAASQGYDNQWRKVRLAYLRLHPLCEMCEKEGKIVPAGLVHHIKEIKDGGARLDFSNLMALCDECHEKIHGKERWQKRKA